MYAYWVFFGLFIRWWMCEHVFIWVYFCRIIIIYFFFFLFLFRLSSIAIFTASDICCCCVSLLSLWLCLLLEIVHKMCASVLKLYLYFSIYVFVYLSILLLSAFLDFFFYFRLLPMSVLFFLLSPLLSLCVYNLLLRFTQQTTYIDIDIH